MEGDTIEVSCKFRDPKFSETEELKLLDLIEQYKHIILVKSMGYAAQVKKEETWRKIAEIWNNNNYITKRSADRLRLKWENLRKNIHKSDLSNPVTKKVHALFQDYNAHKGEMDDTFFKLLQMDTAENEEDENVLGTSLDIGRKMSVEVDSSGRKCLTIYPAQDSNTDKIRNNYLTPPRVKYDKKKVKYNSKQKIKVRERGSNFTQAEISLLLQCAKRETDVFSASIASDAVAARRDAWVRITNSYNKFCPKKRDKAALMKKFIVIRNMVTHGLKGLGHGEDEQVNEDEIDTQRIKTEVTIEMEEEDSVYNKFGNNGDVSDNGHDDVSYNNNHDYSVQNNEIIERVETEFRNHIYNTEIMQQNNKEEPELPKDPLGIMHSPLRDSGNGFSSPILFGIDKLKEFDQVENPEIVKLKLDLLKYEMETAKLQRTRIENLMREDEKARESSAIERALRLRAARLEAEAAANKLPLGHRALRFPPSETSAEEYLRQC